MDDPARSDPEDAFRTDVARLVQAMRHYLSAPYPPEEVAPLVASVQRLASLLDSGAADDVLRDAAVTAIDVYEWPAGEEDSADEDALDPAMVAAMERLRTAVDDLDSEDPEDGPDQAASGR